MLTAFDFDTPPLVHELFPKFMAEKSPQMARSIDDYKPSGHSSEQIRDWLLASIEREGITATEWARNSNIAPSTLNRFINSDDRSANLSARTIDNLATGMGRIIKSRGQEVSLNRDYFQVSKRRFHAVDIPLIGTVSARNDVQYQDGNLLTGRSFVAPVMYQLSNQRLAGFATSDNFRGAYSSGTILFATPVFEWTHLPIKDAKYIFHSRREDGKLRATIYVLKQDPSGSFWFMPVGEQMASNPGIFLGRRSEESCASFFGKATFIVIGHVSPESGLQRHFDEIENANYEARLQTERDEEADIQENGSEPS